MLISGMRILGAHVASFVENAWISYRALFRWYAPTSYVASKILLPLELLLLFTLLGRFALGPAWVPWIVVGNSVLMAAQNGVYGLVITIGEERFAGTLPLILSTPANRFAVFCGRGLVHALDGMVSVAVALLLASLVFRINFSQTNWGVLAAAIVVAALSTTGFGLLLGSVSLMVRDVYIVMNTAYLILLALAGVTVPVRLLPEWAVWITPLLPVSRSAEAARGALSGASMHTVAGSLGIELLVGSGYMVLGFLVYRYLEVASRRCGQYDM